MDDTAEFLTTIGGVLLFGLLTDFLGRHTFLPRVTLLLLFGLLIGHEGLDLISSVVSERFEIITNIALLMVGFLLGGKLTGESLRSCGSQLFWISVSAVAGTWLAVLLGLLTIGVQLEVAILLACVATATAPAATLDVVVETGSKGRFANLLLEIVAIDDVWALILFAFGVSLVALMMGNEEGAATILSAFWQIGGALLLGLAIGVPAAYLSGRIRPGQPMLIEALGLVFLCGGIAIWLDLSYLIASMVMGSVIVNLARHHDYPFHAIENVDSPMMVLFFVFAGASLELNALVGVGLIGVTYVVCRSAGKLLGAWLGAIWGGSGERVRRWMGLALLPQAGVAIGMALVASTRFPEHRQMLLSVVIGTTIFFELIGPVFSRWALQRGERRG